MSLFDPAEFFNQRYRTVSPVSSLKGTRAGEVLQQKQAATQALKQYRDEVNNSFASQYAEPGSFTHGAIDNAARFYNATGRAASDVVAGVPTLGALGVEGTVHEGFELAYQAQLAGKATPEQQKLLTDFPEVTQKLDIAHAMREFADVTKMRNTDSDVAVDPTARMRFSDSANASFDYAEQAYENGDKLTALYRLVKGAGNTLLDNPSAVGEFVVETMPDLIAGLGTKGIAMGASNIGYGLDTYRQGVEQFRDTYGRAPTESEERDMLAWGMSAAAAEMLGDVTLLKPVQAIADLAIARKVSNQVNQNAAVKAIKESKLSAPLEATGVGVGTIGRNTLTEGATEGYQTYAEAKAAKGDPDARAIYESAIAGAGAGGAITAPSALVDTADVLAEPLVTETERREEIAKASKTAKDSGDIAPLLDKDSDTYSPETAASILAERVQDPDLGETDKTQAQADLNKLLRNQGNLAFLADVETKAQTEEGRAALEDTKKGLQQEIDALPEGADAGDLAKKIKAIDLYTQQALDNPVDEAQQKVLETSAQETQAEYDSVLAAVKAQNRVTVPTNTKPKEDTADTTTDNVTRATQLISTIEDNKVPEAEKESATDSLKTLLMADPAAVSPNTLQKLKGMRGLTEAAKADLANLEKMAEAFRAAQNADTVDDMILNGNTHNTKLPSAYKFKGVADYQQEIQLGQKLGNADVIKTAKSDLTRLLGVQQAKLAGIAKAQQEVQVAVSQGKRKRNIPVENLGRAFTTGTHPNSQLALENLRKSITNSVNAIEAVLALSGSVPTAVTKPTPQVKPQVEEQTRSAVKEKIKEDIKEKVKEKIKGKVQEKIHNNAVSSAATTAPAAVAAKTTPKTETEKATKTTLDRELEEVFADAVLDQELKEAFAGLGAPNTTDEKVTAPDVTTAPMTVGEIRQALAIPRGKKAANTPLAKVRDFFSTLLAPELSTALVKYVKAFKENKRKHLTEEEEVGLDHFNQLQRAWAPVLNSYFKGDISPTLGYAAPHSIFATKDNQLPENVTTAIGFSMYSYLVEAVSGRAVRNMEDTFRLLGMNDWDSLNQQEYATFSRFLASRNNAIDTLGTKAINALGIKQGGVGDITYKRLKNSLGGLAYAALIDQQLLHVEAHVRPNKKIKYNKKGEPTNKSQFVLLPRDWNNRKAGFPLLHQNHVDMKATGRETVQLLEQVFSGTVSDKLPRTSPAKVHSQKTKSNSDIPLSPSMTEAGTAYGKVANQLQPDVLKVTEALPQEFLIDMLTGFDADFPHHAEREFGAAAKRGAIANSFDKVAAMRTYLDTYESGIETSFYHTLDFWRISRAGIKNSGFNPQGDKVHRGLSRINSHETFLDMQSDSPEAVAGRQLFKLAALQALGVDIGKQTHETSYQDFDALVADPETQAAVKAMQKVLDDKAITDTEAGDIKTFVIDAGEDMHSLVGLIHLTKFIHAQENNLPSFTTDLPIEVDGVTNGPAFTSILLGTATPAQLQAFGLLKAGESSSIPEFVEKGGLDLYKQVGITMMDYQKKAALPNEVLHALDYLYGLVEDTDTGVEHDIKGIRKAVKTPITALFFGANVFGVTGHGMLHNFLDGLYKKIGKATDAAQKSNGQDVSELVILSHHLNALLDTNTVDLLNNPLNFRLTPQQEKRLADVFKKGIGKPMQLAIEQHFSHTFDTAAPIQQTAYTMHTLFDGVASVIEQQYLKALYEKGDTTIVREKKNKTYTGRYYSKTGLTPKQQTELDAQLLPYRPLVHTAFSALDGDITTGHDISRTESAFMEDSNPQYTNSIALAKPLTTATTGTTKSLQYKIKGKRYSSPGNSLLPNLIHAFDSFVLSRVYKDVELLSAHDAAFLGLHDAHRGAKRLNQATFEALRNYSLIGSVAQGYQRQVEAVTQLLAQDTEGTVHAAIKKSLDDALKLATAKAERETIQALQPLVSQDTDKFVNQLQHDVGRMTQLGLVQDIRKLGMLRDTEQLNQYGFHNGSYSVNDTDRKRIDTQIETLKDSQGKQQAPQVPEAQPEAEVPTQTAPAKETPDTATRETPWGDTGSNSHTHDTNLLKAISPEGTPAKSVLAALRHTIQGNTLYPKRKQEFYTLLIKQLAKSLPQDTTLKMVTPDTPFPENAGLGRVKTAFGAYVIAENTIYIKSPDFVHARVDAELVLHELVHAAVFHYMDSNPDAPEVKELHRIHEAAKTYAADKDLTGFAGALSNVHETVAWGMTNGDFQRRVLSKLDMGESTARKHTLYSAIEALVRNLARILFRDSYDQLAHNGLVQLFVNTSLAMESSRVTATRGKRRRKALFQQDPAADVMKYSMTETFDALGQGQQRLANPRHRDSVRQSLSQIVTGIFGSEMALQDMMQKVGAVTSTDALIDAIKNGNVPFTTDLAPALKLGSQGTFALETIELALRETFTVHRAPQRDVYRLFQRAKTALKGTGLEGYEAIFDVGDADKSVYLSRFMAAAIVHEPLKHALMGMKAKLPHTPAKTLYEAISATFQKILGFISRHFLGTQGADNISEELLRLGHKIITVQQRKNSRLAVNSAQAMDGVNAAIAKTATGLRETTHHAFGRKWIRNSRYNFVKAVGITGRALTAGEPEKYYTAYKDFRDKLADERLGFVGELFNEIKGETDDNALAYSLLNASNIHDQQRQFLIEETNKQVREWLPDLSNEAADAITLTMIGFDLAKLTQNNGVEDLQRLLTVPKAVDSDIARLERELAKQLRSVGQRTDVLNNAKALGYFLVTQRSTHPALLLNAKNIAGNINSTQPIKQAKVRDAIEPIVDKLASLYALKYAAQDETGKTWLNELRTLMQDSTYRKGIGHMLDLHTLIQQDALATVFKNDPTQMIKGYIKDISDPHIDVVAADSADGALLEAAGYTRIAPLRKAGIDRHPDAHFIYLRDGGGTNRYVTGAAVLTGKRKRGTDVMQRLINDGFVATGKQSYTELQAMNRQTQQATKRLGKAYDPVKAGNQVFAVPVVNQAQGISGYRYMMNRETRQLRNPIYRVDKVIGAMVGHTFDKDSADTINENLVKAMFQQYQQDHAQHPNAYIEVSPYSKDLDIRETYMRLPEAMKNNIVKVWGSNRMYIRNDQYNIVMGYRAFSAVTALERLANTNTLMESNIAKKIVIDTIIRTNVLNPKMLNRLHKAEDAWQELIKLLKDNVVIKNVITLVDNILSNVALLHWYGVPMKDMARLQTDAAVGIINYQRDRRELYRLTLNEQMGHTGLGQRRRELEDAIEKNPIKPLIDAGLLQTIVEDVATDEDPYAYTTRIKQGFEEKLDKVPESVKRVGQEVFMTHETATYQVLKTTTQYSDFIARYALYHHLQGKKAINGEPYTEQEILRKVRAAFINYDVPTSPAMEYLNAMGFMMFTKYFLRIQRIIVELWREQPARGLLLVALSNWLGHLPTIMDSSILGRVGNPLEAGALAYPASVTEIAPVKALLSPL